MTVTDQLDRRGQGIASAIVLAAAALMSIGLVAVANSSAGKQLDKQLDCQSQRIFLPPLNHAGKQN